MIFVEGGAIRESPESRCGSRASYGGAGEPARRGGVSKESREVPALAVGYLVQDVRLHWHAGVVPPPGGGRW
jgi:hypothetical protein